MAFDFQICFPQQSVQLQGVTLVPDSNPATLDVVGDDFTSVDEVWVNEFLATSYYVISKNRLFVTVPEEITIGSPVLTVSVTSRNLVFTKESILKFQVNRVPSKVNGILRLLQLFVKTLLTTPGTDIFSKKSGGGGMRGIGRTFSRAETGGIVSDFVVSVDNTTRQLIATQSRRPGIPADERLLTAKVTSSNFSVQESGLMVSIEVTSHAGRSATANVVT